MRILGALAVVLAFSASFAAADYVHNISVPLVSSMDLMGDSSNVVWQIDVAAAVGLLSGTPVVLNGIGWDTWLATNGNSTLAESIWYFDDNATPSANAFLAQPGAGQGAPGTMHFDTGGIHDLAYYGLPTVLPLTTGWLRLEFCEDSKDDFPNAPDAEWRNGTISIRLTPEPASLALLAAALLLRRRG
jgi:hypothetical protein